MGQKSSLGEETPVRFLERCTQKSRRMDHSLAKMFGYFPNLLMNVCVSFQFSHYMLHMLNSTFKCYAVVCILLREHKKCLSLMRLARYACNWSVSDKPLVGLMSSYVDWLSGKMDGLGTLYCLNISFHSCFFS